MLSVEESVSILLFAREDYRKTLELAVQDEEQHENEPHYLGWAWYNVETHPSKLMRLVTEGIVRINFKSNSSTNYKLKDRDAVKKSLAGFDRANEKMKAKQEIESKRSIQGKANIR